MKIYRNEKDELVIDGDGITTIEVAENIRGIKGVNEWMQSRLNIDGHKNILITKFYFKWPEISDSELGRFKNVTEINN